MTVFCNVEGSVFSFLAFPTATEKLTKGVLKRPEIGKYEIK